jgi:hypothetical protein
MNKIILKTFKEKIKILTYNNFFNNKQYLIHYQYLNSKNYILKIDKKYFTIENYRKHFENLNLKENSTKKEVKNSYLRLTKIHHPDLINQNEFNSNYSKEKFLEIKNSYDRLNELFERQKEEVDINSNSQKEKINDLVSNIFEKDNLDRKKNTNSNRNFSNENKVDYSKINLYICKNLDRNKHLMNGYDAQMMKDKYKILMKNLEKKLNSQIILQEKLQKNKDLIIKKKKEIKNELNQNDKINEINKLKLNNDNNYSFNFLYHLILKIFSVFIEIFMKLFVVITIYFSFINSVNVYLGHFLFFYLIYMILIT